MPVGQKRCTASDVPSRIRSDLSAKTFFVQFTRLRVSLRLDFCFSPQISLRSNCFRDPLHCSRSSLTPATFADALAEGIACTLASFISNFLRSPTRRPGGQRRRSALFSGKCEPGRVFRKCSSGLRRPRGNREDAHAGREYRIPRRCKSPQRDPSLLGAGARSCRR